MSLPKIAHVNHELTVPSTGKKIKFRPYLVKEEKVLILARESGSEREVINAIKAVIDACVLTRGFNVDELATFDVEYLFLAIRGRSVGEDVEVIYTCPDDGVTQVPLTIHLSEVGVMMDDAHTNKIKLDNKWSVEMKYPTVDMALSADIEDISVEQSFKLIANCIGQIYTEEESFTAADSTEEELVEWVESLQPSQFQKIEEFFLTMPKLKHVIMVTNPNTEEVNECVLEGLQSFFA